MATNLTFRELLRPKTERSRPESISLPESQWDYIDRDAAQAGSNRSRWLRAAAEYAQSLAAGGDATDIEIPAPGAATFRAKLWAKTQKYRAEKISMPDSLWSWIDGVAAQSGSDRSKVCQAIVSLVMRTESDQAVPA